MTTALARRRIGDVALTPPNSASAALTSPWDALSAADDDLRAVRQSSWVATIILDLPGGSAWKLHPSSAAHIQLLLSSRCGLVSRNDDVLAISYLADSGAESQYDLAHSVGTSVAALIGLEGTTVSSVEIAGDSD